MNGYPDREFLPAVNSPYYKGASDSVQAYWQGIFLRHCCYCDKPLGECGWVLLWLKNQAHLACHEDFMSDEDKMLSNASLIDEAAKISNMTIAGFKELPSWERMKVIRKVVGTTII